MKRYLVTPATGQVPHVPDVDATLKFVPGCCGPGSGDGGEYATLALIDLAELWESEALGARR